LKNNKILQTRRKYLLKVAATKARGPLKAYQVPLGNWESSVKVVEYQQEKADLAQGDVDKSSNEFKLLKTEDLVKAKKVYKLSVEKDLKEANEKMNLSVKKVKEVQKKLTGVKTKITAAKKVQQDS